VAAPKDAPHHQIFFYHITILVLYKISFYFFLCGVSCEGVPFWWSLAGARATARAAAPTGGAKPTAPKLFNFPASCLFLSIDLQF